MWSILWVTCDSRVTENGFHVATLDVNKICLICIFYSARLVLRMQKYGATVSGSLHILHWKNTLPWAQMECTEETKVWSAQLVSILVSYGQRPTLFMDWLFFFFFFCTITSIDGIMMAVGRWGFNWKGHAQGVRGDTSKSISLPRSLFQLNGLFPTCVFMQVKK